MYCLQESSAHLSRKFDESNVIIECSLDKVVSNEDLLYGSCLLELFSLSPVMVSYHKFDVPMVNSANNFGNY